MGEEDMSVASGVGGLVLRVRRTGDWKGRDGMM